MGKSDLPDMYAQARGRAAPEGECGHIRQITTAHVTYVMQHFWHMKNRSALYRQGWRFQLRHLEFNVVMTYIYTRNIIVLIVVLSFEHVTAL